MANHQIVNPADHAKLRIKLGAGAEFGDNAMACFVVPAEFRRLACEYPILFRYDHGSDGFHALALMGFEENENLYLADGQWNASCRPLAMAVQPFLVGRPQDGAGIGQVHIDMDHPRIVLDSLSEDNAAALFDDEGQPTPYLQEKADMLGALDEGFRNAAAFYEALKRYDLLEPFSMDVTLNSGAAHRMVGYHLINEDKLRGLEPSVLNELHKDGHLERIYMAMASMGNLSKLVRRKNVHGHG